MSIPLDLLIDFKDNEFEFSNAVSNLCLKIYQENKDLYTNIENEEDSQLQEVRKPIKLVSESFKKVLTKKVTYTSLKDEE